MTNTTTHLINPHGGSLTNLLVDSDRQVELKAASRDWPSWDLTPRQLCDLELLLNGGFSPLTGFMGKADFDRVVAEMRLADGTLWPMPITLDVPESVASGLKNGSMLALRDPEGVMLAAIRVDEVYQPDREAEAKAVFGTDSLDHPGVAYTRETVESLLRRGASRGTAASVSLRLSLSSRHTVPTARGVHAPRMETGRRLSNAEPDAPRPSRADPQRGAAGGGEPPDSSRGGDDQARRPRSLHAGSLLPGHLGELSAGHREALAPPARDEDGRSARGRMACHHP